MHSIKIFCPATVANLSCGFDVLGLCLDNIGDEMIIRKTDEPGIRITKITGADLPRETTKNVAGVAAMAMLSQWETDFGFDIEIHKKIRAGSGLGSSAASAAGAVFGINELLGRPFEAKELVWFGGWGENLASGSYHADNVAPALLGAFTLIRGYNPLDVIRIDSPPDLHVVILHPHIVIKTSEARALLRKDIPLKDAISQWGNVGGLISGLYTQDYDLIGRSLHDAVAEPYRKRLIPGFDEAKKAAMAHGALGAGISGSGPAIFALCKEKSSADRVAAAMNEIYDGLGMAYDSYLSPINPHGIKILDKQ